MQRDATLAELRERAKALRIDILEMLTRAGSGHPGGSLSAIDLIAALYGEKLRHDAKRPEWPDRDRFILSKGHGVPALYATLAHHGYFPKSALDTLRQLGSPLQGHPVRGTAPGIEANTGSLGQGLSIAVGMAIAAKLDRRPSRIYCMLGDGEMQEGQVWEALMSAPKWKLDNLVAILDQNLGQIDGPVQEVMNIEPVADKLRAFRWDVREIDGHDFGQILDAYAWADAQNGVPKFIVAHTVKGKGVSFMEHKNEWHGATPSRAQADQAIDEVKAGAR